MLKARDIGRVFERVNRKVRILAHSRSQHRLARLKADQKARFEGLRGRFSEKYGKLKGYGIEEFTTPAWREWNTKVEAMFVPVPPFGFLRERIISYTMFVSAGGKWLNRQVAFLEGEVPGPKLRRALMEDYVGCPLLMNASYLTSHNSIHHLYHLARFAHVTGQDLDEMMTVVEWGGGYGNLAKIFMRLGNGDGTYVIIDTPLFSCIQWLYLATTWGEERVHLLGDPEDKIQAGKINLMPVCFVRRHELSADLFISTWALSESSRLAQDYVVGRKWFNARRLLLAYEDAYPDFPDADRVGQLARAAGATIEEIDFLPGHRYYAFR